MEDVGAEPGSVSTVSFESKLFFLHFISSDK